MKRRILHVFCATVVWIIAGCTTVAPPAPPSYTAQASLGARLFADPRLSGSNTMACITCHDPARAFSDGLQRPTGATGDLHPFNTPGLYNAGRLTRYGWRGDHTQLIDQIDHALFATDPVEMGADANALRRVSADPTYRAQFQSAFATTADWPAITAALTAYVGSLDAGTVYDQWSADAAGGPPLNPAARRGMQLFFDLGCANCHRDIQRPGRPPRYDLLDRQNNGSGTFRTPPLRDVTRTAPYFHDGRFADLAAVLDFYSAGGGADPARSSLVAPFLLTPADRADLIDFMSTLTIETTTP